MYKISKLFLGATIATGCATLLTSCDNHRANNGGPTAVNLVNLGAKGFQPAKIDNPVLLGMSVTLKSDKMEIQCPAGYFPFPDYDGSIDLASVQDPRIENISNDSRMAYWMNTILTSGPTAGGQTTSYYERALMTGAYTTFNWSAISVNGACLQGSNQDWNLTQPS